MNMDGPYGADGLELWINQFNLKILGIRLQELLIEKDIKI